MRTTLDLDEDVLQAAKEIAVARRTTAGKALFVDFINVARYDGGLS